MSFDVAWVARSPRLICVLTKREIVEARPVLLLFLKGDFRVKHGSILASIADSRKLLRASQRPTVTRF